MGLGGQRMKKKNTLNKTFLSPLQMKGQWTSALMSPNGNFLSVFFKTERQVKDFFLKKKKKHSTLFDSVEKCTEV